MPQLALYIVYKYYIRFYFMWTLSYIFKYSIYLKEAGLLPVFPLYFVFTHFKILFKVTFVLNARSTPAVHPHMHIFSNAYAYNLKLLEHY